MQNPPLPPSSSEQQQGCCCVVVLADQDALSVTADLMVMEMESISDDLLVKDMKFMKSFAKEVQEIAPLLFPEVVGQGDRGAREVCPRILDMSFPEIFNCIDTFRTTCALRIFDSQLKEGLWSLKQTVKKDDYFWITKRAEMEAEWKHLKSGLDEQGNDFLLLWLSEMIYTSAKLQLAIRDPRLTVGNIQGQWEQHMRDRLRSKVAGPVGAAHEEQAQEQGDIRVKFFNENESQIVF